MNRYLPISKYQAARIDRVTAEFSRLDQAVAVLDCFPREGSIFLARIGRLNIPQQLPDPRLDATLSCWGVTEVRRAIGGRQ